MATALSDIKLPKLPKLPKLTKLTKLPWNAIRIVAILLVAAITVYLVLPYAEGFVDEALSSKAVSKARVLQRGAQIVATQRLVSGDSTEAAADYLRTPSGVEQILNAAGYPVTAVEITGAALDKKGLLTEFSCVVEYEARRYTVEFDIAGHSGKAVFLETVPNDDAKEKTP